MFLLFGRTAAGIALMLLGTGAMAVEQIRLSLGTLGSGDWQLRGGTLVIDWSQPGQAQVTVQAESLDVGSRHVDNISLACKAFELGARFLDCSQGQLSLHSDWVKADAVPATLHYDFANRALSVSAASLAFAGGRLQVKFHHAGDRWRLEAGLVDTALSALTGLLAQAGANTGGLQYHGRVGGSLTLDGSAGGLAKLGWKLATRKAGYSNATGDQAAQDLVLQSEGVAISQGQDWSVRASLHAEGGMVYADPVYLEFSPDHPLDLSAAGRRLAAGGELVVSSLGFDQPGVVDGSLKARIAPAAGNPLQTLHLEIAGAQLPGLYTTWLQPWLAGTALGKLDTEGRLQGRIDIVDGRPRSAQLRLKDVSLHDRDGHFGIGKVDGDLHWDSQAARVSTLAWQEASVYSLQLGAAKVALQMQADSVTMQSPLVVPLFDGQLHVDRFELGVPDGQLRWLVDANLTPVSMRAVSTALGWPALSGKLSGMVPRARYEEGELTLGGVLLVQAFDGDITVRNLRIRQPLGLVPRLWADVGIDNLDLRTLTEAFSFGRIEGRLDGYVKDLYMEAWKPVAFDALFETPPDDHSRHRISQRAVDNISDLGGAGMAGALSRSFLRFLEDFPYRRLGIHCRLENGVCHMGGVAPADNGYYLVQGTTLPPRLDVRGYATEVDWSSLVQRLEAITAGSAPVVR